MKRMLAALAAIPAVLLWAGPVLAQGYRDNGYHWHDGWGWGHMIFGGLFMVAFWVGIIVLIVLAIRWLVHGTRNGAGSRTSTALDVLEERYARGEIDHDEFEQRRRLLKD